MCVPLHWKIQEPCTSLLKKNKNNCNKPQIASIPLLNIKYREMLTPVQACLKVTDYLDFYRTFHPGLHSPYQVLTAQPRNPGERKCGGWGRENKHFINTGTGT